MADEVGRAIGDGLEHIAQPGFGVDAIQFGGLDQRVDDGVAGEQVVAAAVSTGNRPSSSSFCLSLA